MPELCRFYGIIITMYGDDHYPPHLHARYNEFEATLDLSKGVFIKGALPSKQARLVLAWYEIHKNELEYAWECVQNGKEFTKIDPI
jgi:hypothetical protein